MLEDFVEKCFKKGKHDNIVKRLEKRLYCSGLYTEIKHSAEYSVKPHVTTGEVDIIACVGNRFFLFEIKSNNSEKKSRLAAHQLLRAQEFIKNKSKSNCLFYKFYVSGYSSDNKGIIYNIQRIK